MNSEDKTEGLEFKRYKGKLYVKSSGYPGTPPKGWKKVGKLLLIPVRDLFRSHL